MSYAVKEVFFTLQGEGANTGRPAVFCRFSGCNLWSGREEDRATAACRFCDTDFVGGTRHTDAAALADAIVSLWPGDKAHRFCVLTGGEPALQADHSLMAALRERHFTTALETNGTVPLKAWPDWITVSPKTADLAVTDGDELKLVYPQDTLPPEQFVHLHFRHFYLQPMDAPRRRAANTRAAIEYCRKHPQWRLSLQTHKVVGIP